MDYEIVYIFIVTSLLAIVLVGGFIGFALFNQKRQKRNWQDKQDLEEEHQKGLLKAFIETQENERKRIAEDLHDEIGAALAVAKMMFSQVSSLDAKNQEQIKEGLIVLQDTAENTRRISHNLMPAALETVGLKKTLARLLENSCKNNMEYLFNYNPNIELEAFQELAFFRISQELIANTLKHSKANKIELSLELQMGFINYAYFDDGIGYPKLKISGLGLQNIESRSQSIGASISFYREASKTGVEIKMPYAK